MKTSFALALALLLAAATTAGAQYGVIYSNDYYPYVGRYRVPQRVYYEHDLFRFRRPVVTTPVVPAPFAPGVFVSGFGPSFGIGPTGYNVHAENAVIHQHLAAQAAARRARLKPIRTERARELRVQELAKRAERREKRIELAKQAARPTTVVTKPAT